MPEGADLRVMGDHPREGSGAGYGIDIVERAILEALFDVLANVVANVAECCLKEDVGECVTLKSAEKKKPDKARIAPIHFEQAEGNGTEEGRIIFSPGSFSELGLNTISRLANFELDDCEVEGLFAWKVSEDDRLADACAFGDLLGSGSVEAFPGKELGGDENDLMAPVGGAHARRYKPRSGRRFFSGLGSGNEVLYASSAHQLSK